MAGRRIGYGLALFLALAFRIAYTDWLAGFLLAFLLLLPPAGLIAGLPAVLAAKVSLSAGPDELPRGTSGSWVLEGQSALGLPLGRVRVKIRVKNLLTGEQTVRREAFFLPARGTRVTRAGRCAHCGLFLGDVAGAWGTDALGLFWLPLRKGPPARQLVLPAGWGEPPDLPQTPGPSTRPRLGGGPGEDYDPREYRPGDPLNMIHWKLSAKRDNLIVRETLEEIPRVPVLTFDHFGPAEVLDETFELLRAAGNRLLEEGKFFDVAWAEAERGELRRFPVRDEAGFRACLAAALEEPAPLTGKSVLDFPALPGGIHIKPEVEEEPS